MDSNTILQFKYNCMLHYNFKSTHPSQRQQHWEGKHRRFKCLLLGISVRPSPCSTLSPEACHSAGHYSYPPHQFNIAPQIGYIHPSQQTSCILVKGPNTSLLCISFPTWGWHFIQCLPSSASGKRYRKHPSCSFTLVSVQENIKWERPFS